MVLMSFRAKAILIPVTKSNAKKTLALLKTEFGDRFRIFRRGGHITVEGDDVRDYRIRDRIYEIAQGS
jgi:hypothetical protein